jgi:hypothetical protein
VVPHNMFADSGLPVSDVFPWAKGGSEE